MTAEDRRELVLAAATRAFARGGYAGTSTDAVAKEAGVSQPYVVRIFGTKLAAVPRGVRPRLRPDPGGLRGGAGRRAVRPRQRGRLGPARAGLHRAAPRPRPAAGDDARLRGRRRRRRSPSRAGTGMGRIFAHHPAHRLHRRAGRRTSSRTACCST